MTWKQLKESFTLKNVMYFIQGHYLKFIDLIYNIFTGFIPFKLRNKIAQCPQCYIDGSCNGSRVFHASKYDDCINPDDYKFILFCSTPNSFKEKLELETLLLDDVLLELVEIRNDYQAVYTIKESVLTNISYQVLKEKGCGCDWSQLLTDKQCHNKRF